MPGYGPTATIQHQAERLNSSSYTIQALAAEAVAASGRAYPPHSRALAELAEATAAAVAITGGALSRLRKALQAAQAARSRSAGR